MMEMMVAVGVAAIMAAIAVPGFYRMSQRSALRASANRLVAALKLARTAAASGKSAIPGWAVTDRTVEAGVRFGSATEFAVFVDRDQVVNNPPSEADIRTFDLTDDYPSFRLVGPPTEIRYQRNGMLVQPPDVDIVLEDGDTGLRYTIRATFGGRVEIRD